MTALWFLICGLILFHAIEAVFPSDKEAIFSSEKPCTPGFVYKQSCNICKCHDQGELICTKMACPEDLKLLYSKGFKNNKLDENVFKTGYGPLWKTSMKCTPGKFYKKNNHLCFCDNLSNVKCSEETVMGKISLDQIRSPEQVYPSLSDEEFVDLPSLDHTASECEPGRVYRVECDTCLCRQDGDLLCTDLLCLPQQGINRKQADRISGQPCSLKNELKNQCIHCDCIDDILLCTPVSDCKPVLRNLHGPVKRLDTYLDLKHDRCTPNETLLEKCNVCHCQLHGTLRCTQRTCLTYRETKVLRAELEKLSKNDI